uniref:DUF3891 family protein n=1 Tax=Cohnella candidum TaxID=2674991 RepID=A0A3G3JW64_9BACL|nr:DUF3891 family protein [Cohnella candidum]
MADKIDLPPADTVRRHFGLLQLCDDISLYVCLNNPGATKTEEHPWYVDGFRKSEGLGPAGQGKLVACWVSEAEVGFDPMPFVGGFTAKLRQKVVPKELIKQEGLQEAYWRAAWWEQEIGFVGK